jgi:SWI/SNF-related matrix-associated actin-dependent regulator 1 of chromatin subfamily A
MELYPYQREGVNFLKNRKFAMLWDEPGLGKSAQSITAWRELEVKSVLVICPASVRSVWEREIRQWDGTRRVIFLYSYEGAVKNASLLKNIDLVVIDEAHYLKSKTAKRTKVILGEIVKNADRAWFLTGTPMPNNPSELWPILHAAFPDAIAGRNGRPMTYWQFVNRYCTTKNNGFGIQITGGRNLGELRDRLFERAKRRTVKKVLKDLPPYRHLPLPVSGDLRGIPEKDMELVAEALAKDGDPLDNLRTLGTHVASLRRLTALAKVKGVVNWCKDNIDNYGKMVIFAHHREVLEELAMKLDDTVMLHGGTSQNAKQIAIDKFQNGDAKYFLGQITAAGTGITLTAARLCLFAEFSWVPTDNEQASKRIHRIGQKESCLAYYAMIEGSIDERILEAVQSKRQTIKELGL